MAAFGISLYFCHFAVHFSILVTKLQLNYDVLLIFEMLMCTGFQRCQLAILHFTISVLLCDTVFGIFFVFFCDFAVHFNILVTRLQFKYDVMLIFFVC